MDTKKQKLVFHPNGYYEKRFYLGVLGGDRTDFNNFVSDFSHEQMIEYVIKGKYENHYVVLPSCYVDVEN